MIKYLLSLLGVLALCVGNNIEAKTRALLIGIGNYNTSATGMRVLHGNNDVALLSGKLKANGCIVSTLTDLQATKANILKALSNLEGAAQPGDVVYLHFSGHGQLIPDLNKDEPTGYDQSFVCYDACLSSDYKIAGSSYRGQNHLIDDELFPYINRLKRKVGVKGNVVVAFDSCFSGGADRNSPDDDSEPGNDVEWVYDDSRGAGDKFEANENAMSYLRTIKKPGRYTHDGGTLTIISACKSDQKNYECKEKHSGRRYGSLSFCISKLLDKKIRMTQWADYFRTGKFRSLGIIRGSQTPVIETFK